MTSRNSNLLGEQISKERLLVKNIENKYLKKEEDSHCKSNFNRLYQFLSQLDKHLRLLDSAGKTFASIYDFSKSEVGIPFLIKRHQRVSEELRVSISTLSNSI